jgi:histidinol-phosphate aminotransferase
VVVLRTFSKAYGLAAVRAGYAVAPKEVVAGLDRVRAPFNLSSLAQAAALAALDDRAHLAKAVALNQRERKRVTQALQALGLSVAPSQANFLHVTLSRQSRPVYESLLERGVIVRPLVSDERALRISIGLEPENDRLLASLREVIA